MQFTPSRDLPMYTDWRMDRAETATGQTGCMRATSIQHAWEDRREKREEERKKEEGEADMIPSFHPQLLPFIPLCPKLFCVPFAVFVHCRPLYACEQACLPSCCMPCSSTVEHSPLSLLHISLLLLLNILLILCPVSMDEPVMSYPTCHAPFYCILA